MTGTPVTREAILEMLVGQLALVLDIEPTAIAGASRFDEDLHADSLDLVEVVESVEARLRAQGIPVRLPEDQLVTLRTVGDAADRLLAACSEAGA